ncbi:hypothetical protein ACFV8Z_37550 [Streptomyces sp. NPDC059837]
MSMAHRVRAEPRTSLRGRRNMGELGFIAGTGLALDDSTSP